jgi:hypothetical protein
MPDENKKERSAPGAAAGAGAASTSATTSATTAKDEFQRVVSQHDKHAGRLARDLGKKFVFDSQFFPLKTQTNHN